MTDPAAWSFETRQIHAGTSPDPTTGVRALPIYATTAYQFRDRAVLTFELHGGREAGQQFVEALELHSHVANIGDVRSLVIHPASTTHSQLTPEEQLTTGVTPGPVRLAVGLEGIEDILADLEAGFRAAKGA